MTAVKAYKRKLQKLQRAADPETYKYYPPQPLNKQKTCTFISLILVLMCSSGTHCSWTQLHRQQNNYTVVKVHKCVKDTSRNTKYSLSKFALHHWAWLAAVRGHNVWNSDMAPAILLFWQRILDSLFNPRQMLASTVKQGKITSAPNLIHYTQLSSHLMLPSNDNGKHMTANLKSLKCWVASWQWTMNEWTNKNNKFYLVHVYVTF
jgi:hypothetical protein